MMDGWSMTGWGWFWMVTMMVGGVALLALLIALLVPRSGPTGRDDREPPLRTLDARFARGDISAEEYQHARALLRAPAGPAATVAPAEQPLTRRDWPVAHLTCEADAVRLERDLQHLPGVRAVQVNPVTERAYVTFDPGITGEGPIAAAIAAFDGGQ